MNRFDKTRVVAGFIALVCLAIAYAILSVIMIETSKAAPPKPELSRIGPEIPQCDKELWLRIKDGCKDE